MPQVLHLDSGKTIDIDMTFTDAGQGAEFQVVGGRAVIVAQGRGPLPMIHKRGDTFLYADGRPVTDPAHVAHLPEPYQAQALRFIEGASARPAASRGSAGRRRGRPARVADDPTRIRPAKPGSTRRLTLGQDVAEAALHAPEEPEPDAAPARRHRG